MFSAHRIYLVKKLLKHPVYKNQIIGFDMKYDTAQLAELNEKDLSDIYSKKSLKSLPPIFHGFDDKD